MNRDSVSVTVGIPVYRGISSLLRRSIDSAISQKNGEIELSVVVVFDGLSENKEIISSGIVDEYPQVDFRIEDHAGVSNTRNIIIDSCTTDWIIFLDADDVLAPGSVQALVRAGEAESADFVASNHYRVYRKKQVEVNALEEDTKWSGEKCIDYIPVSLKPSIDQGTVWAKAFRVPFIKQHGIRFDTHLSNGEDQEFVVRCSLNAGRIVFLNKLTYAYYVNSSSTVRSYSSEYAVRISETIESIKYDLGTIIEEENIKRAFDEYLADRMILIIINYIFNPNFNGGLRARKKAFESLVESSPYNCLTSFIGTGFSMSKRILLYFALKRKFVPVYIIGTLRNIQLWGMSAVIKNVHQ